MLAAGMLICREDMVGLWLCPVVRIKGQYLPAPIQGPALVLSSPPPDVVCWPRFSKEAINSEKRKEEKKPLEIEK